MGGKTVPQIWTHSRIKCRMNCPMLEHLRYEEELTPIRRQDALMIGSAVHKGIETWSIEEAMREFDSFQITCQEDADELEIAKATVAGMLTGYMCRFEPFEDHRPELEFSLPLILPTGRASKKYIVAGKIDDIEITKDGDWIVEYKTAGQLNGAYFERLYVDEQITMYCYAAKRLGFNPIGVKYRVIRKPTIRPRKGESMHQYLDRLTQDYLDRPEFYFYEQKLYRSQDDLEAFGKLLLRRITEFDRAKKLGMNWMNTGHCSVYAGCRYLPLCTRQNGAEALFERKAAHEELGGNDTWD